MNAKQRQPRVVLIEDSQALGRVYQEYLAKLDVEVHRFAAGHEGLAAVLEMQPEVLLLDLNLPDITGQDIMAQLEDSDARPAIIVITAHGSVDAAVEAMRNGAFDFLQKPFDAERLRITVRNALEKQNLADLVRGYQETLERSHFHGFVGGSIPMQAVYRIIESAASSRASVFITGDSGTGKEVCATAIHQEGDRRDKAFVPLNCAAIPRDLMESEIFGHVKGAFTGAAGDRMGAATLADGGTLFLDEIGEMDLGLQSKLLRFVQTGTFQKVGSNQLEKVDVRFISATNRDPLEMVAKGTFREDLYYRLHVIPIHLPALRECGDDILMIARKYLLDFAAEENKSFRDFTQETARILRTYHWPGNVRQLQNVVRNAVVLNDGEQVEARMLPALMLPRERARRTEAATIVESVVPAPADASAGKPLWLIEKEAIEAAIAACDGNVPKAAGLLEVSPSTIYRKKQSWEDEGQA
jgi:two-component system repressor protein LuxO